MLFLFLPFIVNTVLLWLTDKLIGSFEIGTTGALFGSAAVITIVNAAFYFALNAHRMNLYQHAGPTRWI